MTAATTQVRVLHGRIETPDGSFLAAGIVAADAARLVLKPHQVDAGLRRVQRWLPLLLVAPMAGLSALVIVFAPWVPRWQVAVGALVLLAVGSLVLSLEAIHVVLAAEGIAFREVRSWVKGPRWRTVLFRLRDVEGVEARLVPHPLRAAGMIQPPHEDELPGWALEVRVVGRLGSRLFWYTKYIPSGRFIATHLAALAGVPCVETD